MKIKFTRKQESWPETEYFQRLRSKGFSPKLHVDCEIIEKDDLQLEGTPAEHQYMPSQLRDDMLLEDDLNKMIQSAESVMNGSSNKWEATGNAWTVVLKPEGAVFEFSIMDGMPGGLVSLNSYIYALKAWKEFLADEKCLERVVSLPN